MGTISLECLLSRNWAELGVTGLAGLAGLAKRVNCVRRFGGENEGYFTATRPRTTIMVIAPRAAPRLSLEHMAALQIPCLVLAGVNAPGEYLVQFAERTATPVICSLFDEYLLACRFLGLLRVKLQQRLFMQGALVNVDGLGILITGASGIGKTTWALELAGRGHNWIADDAVEIERRSESRLYGRSHQSVKNLLEIKGKGIVDIRNLRPYRCIAEETSIDMVVEIGRSSESSELLRKTAGLVILGVRLPLMKFTISCHDDRDCRLEMAVKILKETG